MKQIKKNKTPFSLKALTIGTFDGVHLGHQKILKSVITLAKEKGLKSAVLTLFPHPRMVLNKDSNIKLLNTIDERIAMMKTIGIDEVIVKEFTVEFSQLSAEDYVKQILVDALQAKTIIIGYDHHFGKNRSANIKDLIAFSKDYDFEVQEINALTLNDVNISSTKIRTALSEGNVTLANEYLGYEYTLTGKVVYGKKLGRKIGFRTANIDVEADYKLIPKDGVYVVKSEINKQTYFGMMNIGQNPTIENAESSIEVHYFDFDQDLYGQTISVKLLKRLRDEYHFESIEALKVQLEKDKVSALKFLNKE